MRKQAVRNLAAVVLFASSTLGGHVNIDGSSRRGVAARARRTELTRVMPPASASHHSDPRQPAQIADHSRRNVLSSVLGAIGAFGGSALTARPALAAAVELGLDPTGQLLGCPADSNCVSTMSALPESYRPVWSTADLQADYIVRQIARALDKQIAWGSRLELDLKEEVADGNRYVRFIERGAFGSVDSHEFLIKKEKNSAVKLISIRDAGLGAPANFRVAVRSARLEGKSPFLSDIRARGNMLERVREELRFGLAGCDLPECSRDSAPALLAQHHPEDLSVAVAFLACCGVAIGLLRWSCSETSSMPLLGA
eukprot:gnl/TRDRNA2_/TRDRNA2_87422_c0_seq1.p1 gnl/TRDRNA2_/TRDRNA2_87422_c0~~gnl/TRDRNA2_/TRDRNA2_87422_c0_seq1.p1  ORF type:complete len:312 (-),score=25.44 gnl/TRDRNA2_/TRDRNA2_87422_c0_seq1:295-1230(-)